MSSRIITRESNYALLYDNLDFLDEMRDLAKLRLTSYHQNVARQYNKNVRARMFRTGDMMLKKVLPNKRDPRHGKLAESWEGPYTIDSVVGQGAYRLQAMDGTIGRSFEALSHVTQDSYESDIVLEVLSFERLLNFY